MFPLGGEMKLIDKLLKLPFEAALKSAVWKRVDAFLLDKLPNAWPAFKRAVPGWKLLTGLVIVKWPVVTAFVLEVFHLLGIESDKAIPVIGMGLVLVGAVDKALAFMAELLGFKVAGLPSGPVLRDEKEHDFFASALSQLRKSGMSFEDARREALERTLVAFPR
jgi:hypothetical protein